MNDRWLTHGFAEVPNAGRGEQFDVAGGQADEDDEQVGQRQVHQEDVGRVAQVLAVRDHDRHQHVAGDAHQQQHRHHH